MDKIYIGTSGYIYKHWGNGVFYPPELPQKEWFNFYCKTFNTVELNVTFYRLVGEEVFKNWYKKSPKNFSFVVKGSRFITHIKRLKDPGSSLQLFFKRASLLKEKLRVVLWQLPPKFKADIVRLEKFLKELKQYKTCKFVFEFRNPGWFEKDIIELLKSYNIAICKADWPLCSKNAPDIANFIYIRRHGTEGQLYGGCYSEEQLHQDANFIRSIDKTTFIYFNNDAYGHAIRNAIQLKEILSIHT